MSVITFLTKFSGLSVSIGHFRQAQDTDFTQFHRLFLDCDPSAIALISRYFEGDIHQQNDLYERDRTALFCDETYVSRRNEIMTGPSLFVRLESTTQREDGQEKSHQVLREGSLLHDPLSYSTCGEKVSCGA